MSYGLDLEAPEGQEIEDKQLSFAQLNDDWRYIMPNPFYYQRKQGIIEAILKLDLGSEVLRLSNGYVEINHENGLQVSIYPHEIGVTIPYWYNAEIAPLIFKDIQQIVIAVETVTNYVTYDSQIGRIIDVVADYDLMLRTYLHTVKAFQGLFGKTLLGTLL